MELIDIFNVGGAVSSFKIEESIFLKGRIYKQMAKKRTSENELVVSPAAAPVPARRKTTAASHKKHKPAISVAEPLAEPAAPPAATYDPTHEEISALAYTYWVARGRQGGCAEEDWLRAEIELRASRAVSA